MTESRANYALLTVQAELGPAEGRLDLPWATYVNNTTDAYAFEVPTDGPREPYVALQAYDVGEFGHELLINGDPLTGFDLPPASGWQYWMDALTGPALHEGENTFRIRRDRDGDDAFAVGTVTIHWKEPI